ncbi:MAG TPA: hypothetical protein PLZ01_02015, partial [bacterium]|nr:hypothetical protein [bacterium]
FMRVSSCAIGVKRTTAVFTAVSVVEFYLPFRKRRQAAPPGPLRPAPAAALAGGNDWKSDRAGTPQPHAPSLYTV